MKNFGLFNRVRMVDEVSDALVDAGIEMVRLYAENRNRELSTSEKEKIEEQDRKFSQALAKHCTEAAGFKYTEDSMKNPQVFGDPNFQRRFANIIAQVINPVAPALVSERYGEVVEVKQVGWGDVARFIVKPNDTFYVNDIAEGVLTGALQRMYNNEFTVTTTPKQIRYDMPWYQVASGIFSFGKL